MTTEPLTPPDCDLTNFKYMPLEVARLRKSTEWRQGKKNPEVAFYSLNLWMASWHEVPSGSLEDDDDALADAAMCDSRRWPKVREKVLRKWVKCSDGRLYHPVVAEKANESWEAKHQNREGLARAREAKKRKAAEAAAKAAADAVANTTSDTETVSVAEPATGLKGSEVNRSEEKGSEGKGTTDAVARLNTDTKRVLDDIEPFLSMPIPITGANVRPWLQAGATPELIIATIRDRTARKRDAKPDWVPTNGLGYFHKAVLEEIEKARATAAAAAPAGPDTSGTPEVKRAILEGKAKMLNAGTRVASTTPDDVNEMLRLGLTTPDKAKALGFAA